MSMFLINSLSFFSLNCKAIENFCYFSKFCLCAMSIDIKLKRTDRIYRPGVCDFCIEHIMIVQNEKRKTLE
jgi:hypothetical protein